MRQLYFLMTVKQGVEQKKVKEAEPDIFESVFDKRKNPEFSTIPNYRNCREAQSLT